MNKYDYISIGALAFTILFNSGMVYLQKSRNIYQKFGSKAFTVHSLLISIPWGLFIGTEFLAGRSDWRLAHASPFVGIIIMAAALALFIAAIKEIGWNALGNGYFFGRPLRNLKGIYRYIKEPIYWSYTVWFFGLGFLTSMKVFFVYSIISVIGLVWFEAWVERPNDAKASGK